MIAPFLAFLGIAMMAVVTVSGTFFGETGRVLDARLEAVERAGELKGTEIELVSATYTGDMVGLVFRNVGRVPLRDAPAWDTWVSFHEVDGTYHPERLTYTVGTPSGDEWELDRIFLDEASGVGEAHQPGIVDPQEEMRLFLNVDPEPADPQSNFATLALPVGVSAKVAFTWQALATGPDAVGWGGALAHDGTYVYALEGGTSREFWRYDPSSNAWTQMSSVQQVVRQGGALAYAEDGDTPYIYAFRGLEFDNFWRYDIAADSWSNRADAPTAVGHGGALAWDGANTIYGFEGQNQASFWAYDIATDTWGALANVPEAVGAGGAMLYLDGAVYALAGSGTTSFYRYTPSTGNWAPLTSTPANVSDGGALTTDGTDIYAYRGNNEEHFWRYSVERDTWTRLPDTPQFVSWGGSLVTLHDTVYGLRGNDTAEFWKWPLPSYTP